MNWKNFFITGLILALSPFHIILNHFVFYYSTLGFGLILLSYIYKKINRNDYFVIAALVLIILMQLLNWIPGYIISLALFFTGVTIFYFADSPKRWVFTVSLVMVGILALFLPLMIAGSFTPLSWITQMVLSILFYVYIISTIVLLIFEYK